MSGPRVSLELVGETQLRIKLENVHDGIPRGITAGIKAALINLQSYIQKEELSGQILKNRTGNLRRSIVWRMDGPISGAVAVGAEAPYGRFQNDGSAPHPISAVNAKALRFSIGDQVMFRRTVMHPGTKATHFMELALKATKDRSVELIQQRINAVIRGQQHSE